MSLKDDIKEIISLGQKLEEDKKLSKKLDFEGIEVYQYSAAYENLLSSLRMSDLLVDFDWLAWGKKAKKYMDDDLAVEKMSLNELRKLFTIHLKTESLEVGHLGAVASSGHLRKILKRLEILANED